MNQSFDNSLALYIVIQRIYLIVLIFGATWAVLYDKHFV